MPLVSFGSNDILSIPAWLLKAPILLLGIGLPDENAHAPNEKLNLDNLHHGILSSAYLWNELAEIDLGKS